MGYYYPQAALTLRVIWEDFNFKSNARLQEVYTLPIIAKRVTVNINDYTQADTFSAEIDFKHFPFDPRSIRACGVTIHMQDMKGVFEPNNENRLIVPSERNTVFLGFADEESITFDDSNRTVRMEGRDFTALLIDRKYTGGLIDYGQPMDVILRQLLAELEETVDLKLDIRGLTTLPTIAQFSSNKVSNSKLGGQRNRGSDESYWDVIQNMVANAGLIAYVELDRLVVTKPRALYDRNRAVMFVYGRNVRELEYKRKIGRQKNFNISVKSLNVLTKEVLQAQIPAEATDAWARATGVAQREVELPSVKPDGTPGEPKPAPYISFRVPDVNSKAHLIGIGEELYEEMGRQQIEGSFKTKELDVPFQNFVGPSAAGVDGECFNLFQLRIGTPVQLEVDQGDMKGVQRLSSVAEKARYLRANCYEPAVAEVLAETLSNPRFNTPFYTKGVQYTLDQESGLEATVNFINFIETPERLR
jgi:hypothetical protein